MDPRTFTPDGFHTRSVQRIDRLIEGFIGLFAAFSVVSIAGTQIALGFLLFFTLLKGILFHRWDIRRTEIDGALLFFALACLLATCFSPKPRESLFHLKHLLLFSGMYLVSQLRTPRQITRVVTVMVLASTAMALLGLLTTDILAGKRVRALQSTTMTWGALSALFTLITTSLFLFGPKGKARWAYFAAWVVQVVGMLFSYVRGAWVGFMAGLFVLAWLKGKKTFGVAIGILLMVFLFSPSLIRERILSITDLSVHSTQVRLTQWRNAVRIVRDHPLVGVGWIDLGEIHRRYAPPGADLSDHAYHIGHFHNNFVMFLVCFGIIGFAAALFFLFRLFRMLFRIHRKAGDGSSLTAGAIAAVTAFWVNGLFDWTFGDAEPLTLLSLIIGLCVAVDGLTERQGGDLSIQDS